MKILSSLSSRAVRRIVAVAAALVAVLCGAGVAWAYWSATGTGTGSAAAATLNAPTNIQATSTPGSGAASITWSPSSVSGSAVAPAGYYVTRVASDDSTAPACATGPGQLTGQTSCTDKPVPDGTYHYVVTAVLNSWTAPSSAGNSVSVSSTRPDVTINQASAQADPTNAAPVNFTVVFSEPVTDFAGSSVTLGGTAPGNKIVTLSGAGPTYTVAVSGMTGAGTVTASIAANTVHDANGVGNTASTSTDNSVSYDGNAPAAPVPGATAAVVSGSSPIYVSDEPVALTDAASDQDTGVASVTYYYCSGASGSCDAGSGVVVGSSSTSAGNYPVTWAAPLPAEGPFRVVAVVRDNAGNATTSNALQIAIDKAAPSVSAPLVNGHS